MIYQAGKIWVNTDIPGSHYNDQASAQAAAKSVSAPSAPSAPVSGAASSAAQAASQISGIRDQLVNLKSQVQAGKLSVTQYMPQVTALVKQANALTGSWAGKGQSAALQVNPPWKQIQDLGFAKGDSSQPDGWAALSGFNSQEYSQLPPSVLPTQNDAQTGAFNPNFVPLARYQTPQGVTNSPATATPSAPAVLPTTKPAAPGQPAIPNSPIQPGQALPGITPVVQPGTDTTTDQGKAAVQGAQNASALQDALNKQFAINQTAVGQLGQGISQIPGIYRQEGQSQQDQLNALANQQKSARAQSLTDLGGILAQNQMNQFNRAIPDLAEQANTSGIYQSTGFGNILAQKYANLTADTQTALAQQGLSDRNAYLGDQQNALQTGLGYSGQAAQAQAQGAQTIGSANAGALAAYGAGLGDVANAQIGMQNAGLQRQFSLQDYATQYSNALNLANQAKVQGPTGKASPGTQAGIQTALGVGNLGVSAAKLGK